MLNKYLDFTSYSRMEKACELLLGSIYILKIQNHAFYISLISNIKIEESDTIWQLTME